MWSNYRNAWCHLWKMSNWVENPGGPLVVEQQGETKTKCALIVPQNNMNDNIERY